MRTYLVDNHFGGRRDVSKKIEREGKLALEEEERKIKEGKKFFLVAEWGNLACLLRSQRGLATALAPDYYLLVSWVF